MNPFAPLYARCNKGDPADKYRDLPDFPRLIDVELTSACNFRCVFCPTGNRSLKRKAEFMDIPTLTAIVHQCREYGTALRFIGWGEPLMHPGVVNSIREASMAGLLTHINTNASKLTPQMAEDLVKARLSSIKFSFQGVDAKSYAEMRQTDFFDGMIQAIQMMRDARQMMRDARGDSGPWIAASTSTTNETPEQIAEFCEHLMPLVDELTVGQTTFDFLDAGSLDLERLKSESRLVKRHPDPCPEVYDKLSIHADGSAVVCCNDHNGVTNLGNVNDTSIAEMWRHPEIEAYRERLARKDYDAPLCETCWDYAGLTEGVG